MSDEGLLSEITVLDLTEGAGLPRDFLLLQPPIGFALVPAALVLLERGLHMPRLPGAFWPALGRPLIALGWGVSLWSAALFVTRANGTPDPNNPPQVLIREGPYRYSRNPMVVGAVLGLVGQAMLMRSWPLCAYVAALSVVLQIYHERTEEPELVARFGQEYVNYHREVPRWLPRLGR